MEVTVSSIVGSIALVSLLTCAWMVVKWVWWRPKQIEKRLREQGFKGNPYKLLYGDMKEIISVMKEARSKPMDASSDDIVPHVIPSYHHCLNLHGKDYFQWMGTRPRVTIANPKHIKEILFNHEVFQKPKQNLVFRYLVSGLGTYEGEKWAKHRNLINPAFHLEKLKHMVPAMCSSCNAMISNWEVLVSSTKGSFEVDVWPYLDNLTADVISRTAFGSNYEEGKRIFQLQKEQTDLVIKLLRSFYIPGWRFLPTKTNRKIKTNCEEVRALMRNIIINKRKQTMKGGDGDNDLLGILLETNWKAIQEQGNKKNITLTTDEVIEECKLFYFAGQETTSALLVWTMVLLSKHQKWQALAREEVLAVFGAKKPDYDGLNQLKTIIMGRKRKPDHPRRMMSDVLHNRTSVAPPLEEASHRPASDGPLVPPPSEGPLPPYRPPSVAPQQLPCTQPPRLPSVRPPSVAPQQLSSSAYEPSADPSTSSQPTSGHVSSSSTSTRRGRGCAKGIKEWGTGKKLDIQFDGNYCPIGDNVAKLTTQLGIIVRNGNIVPLTFVDWNSVPDDIVDAIWKDVKDNLNICPEEYKPICMKNCNSIWKDHKNKLKAKYFKPRSSDPNLKDDVPMNVVPSQWEQLVEYWRTSDAEKIASRNANNRRAHGIAHTTGRTTFTQIRHQMTSKGESTDKMNVWLMTRRVDDPEVIQTLDEFNRQLSMLPEDGRTMEARNAIFHELIGHDRHGYCRTYGRIVPRRVVYKDGAGPSQSTPQPSTIDQIRAELRDELREEIRAEFSTQLQQMRAEMMALVSQGASVDPNRQVPDASSGHRAFRESAEDENPYTPPPEDQIFPE